MNQYTALPTPERFWSYIRKGETDDCWPWEGAHFKNGVGCFGFRKTIWRSHRVAWVLTKGEIPEGNDVYQRCENLRCCNPSHLFCESKESHIRTMYKAGHPLAVNQYTTLPMPERFWIRVARTEDEGCWLWLGGQNKKGYGAFGFPGAKTAHRVAWTLTYGTIPEGMQVLHTCDAPVCCRPSHLFLGSNADNVADRVAKGRSGCAKGENAPKAKLTNAKVIQMRQDFATGNYTKAELGRKYEVSKVMSGLIINEKAWTHLLAPVV